MSTKRTSGSSRAASTAAVRSFASPIAPKYETRKPPSSSPGGSPSEPGSNRSRSAEFGTSSVLSCGRAARIPGERAIRRVLREYTKRSTARASRWAEPVAERPHLDRCLRPQVAHLEHERRPPARGRHERGQRHRERRRGGVDHVGSRAAQRGERGAERKAPEGEHATGVRERGRLHVVGVGAAHAHHLDPVHRPGALPGGYHAHPVPALHEAARELVRARAAPSRTGDEELMQVQDPH